MTTLLIDGNFLSYRAYHTTGELEFEGRPTGVAYGVLRDINTINGDFGVDRTVWTFDTPRSRNKRREIYPEYKANRTDLEEMDEDERRKTLRFIHQLTDLRDKILPDLGYKNIFCVEGYEGDDIIAEVARREPRDERFIIVSADNDLLQCLRNNVQFYNPITKKLIRSDSFCNDYQIHPSEWADVKAMTGCGTDNVIGLKGIGEKTAVAFINQTLKSTSKKYKQIVQGKELIARNEMLVRLPFPGIEVPDLREDKLSSSSKAEVESYLGIRPRRRKRG